jgi:hypothetical protein
MTVTLMTVKVCSAGIVSPDEQVGVAMIAARHHEQTQESA